jgi:hypothetical protein
VASEIGLAIVVLISATLLVKSFYHLGTLQPRIQSGNLMVAQLALPKIKYAQDSRTRISATMWWRASALCRLFSVGNAQLYCANHVRSRDNGRRCSRRDLGNGPRQSMSFCFSRIFRAVRGALDRKQ